QQDWVAEWMDDFLQSDKSSQILKISLYIAKGFNNPQSAYGGAVRYGSKERLAKLYGIADLKLVLRNQLAEHHGRTLVIVPRTILQGDARVPNPKFSDAAMTYLLPPNERLSNFILSTDPICMTSQQNFNETANSPTLRAQAGSFIVLRYQENGHVTLPSLGKPPRAGRTFVYGTTQAESSFTLKEIHKVWRRGSSDSQKGVLLSEQEFDDGRCFQVNESEESKKRQKVAGYPIDPIQGSDLWCRNVIKLPENLKEEDVYTLYWVWDWPTVPGTAGAPEGKVEIYTTCIDILII
ncbi:MAG: hypothetical protein M1834_004244, partial [Cirrosporium novae-zelandiae]